MTSNNDNAARPLINIAPKPKPDALAGTPCAACSVRDLSMCNVLQPDEMEVLSQIVTNVDVAPREPIIDEGEVAGSLFNVTGGAVKLYKLLPDGRRQITGFLFPGDFLGIALNDTYAYSAEAVNQVKLCRFPSQKLEDLLAQFPHMEKRLLGMASNELVQAQEHMLLLGRKSAKEKVCSFLLALSRRAEKRGESASPIAVPMSRADIGDYLGLTTETVSRTFTNLKRDGSIRLMEGGMVEIPDMEKLEDLAEGF